MHLDNRSLLLLSSPFIIASGIWFFAADSLVEGLEYFFEPLQQEQTSVLEKKGQAYAFITENKDEYGSLLKKIEARNKNQFWISERLYQPYSPQTAAATTESSQDLALKAPPPLLQFGEGNISSPVSIPQVLSVQMVLPEQNMAIINNHIMRVGQSIDGVKLLGVESSKVYIQTTKGSQWVKLFH
jgi:hypothetical protein